MVKPHGLLRWWVKFQKYYTTVYAYNQKQIYMNNNRLSMKKGIWFTNLAPTLRRMRIDKTSIPIVLRLSQGRPFSCTQLIPTSTYQLLHHLSLLRISPARYAKRIIGLRSTK